MGEAISSRARQKLPATGRSRSSSRRAARIQPFLLDTLEEVWRAIPCAVSDQRLVQSLRRTSGEFSSRCRPQLLFLGSRRLGYRRISIGQKIATVGTVLPLLGHAYRFYARFPACGRGSCTWEATPIECVRRLEIRSSTAGLSHAEIILSPLMSSSIGWHFHKQLASGGSSLPGQPDHHAVLRSLGYCDVHAE
jgi:hypothetical protein